MFLCGDALLVANRDPGDIVVVDASTGALGQTLTGAGIRPQAIATDASTGHLWVLSEGNRINRGVLLAIVPASSNPSGQDIDSAEIDNWLGGWTGVVEQANYGSYSVEITLSHDGRTVVGTVAYPELGCVGTLEDPRLTGGVLYAHEALTTLGQCVTGTPLELALDSESIAYHYDHGGATGDATLRRM